MEALRKRIEEEAQNLGGGILKVDTFINHRVDSSLMSVCAGELAARFRGFGVTLVLTAETSGIGPAAYIAPLLGVDFVFARKNKPITMPEEVYTATASSHTKGGVGDLIVSSEVIGAADRVLIIDDFLATGVTIEALVGLVEQAGAVLVGIGSLIEKSFEGGRAMLKDLGVPIISLVTISDMSGGQIIFDH